MKIVINESQYYRIISETKYTDDDIRKEASKYNSQNEFKKGSPKFFYTAFNRKMLDNLYPDRIKGKGRTNVYSDEDIRQNALRYGSTSEFLKNSPKLYQLAYNRNILDDLFPDRKKNISYSDDDIRKEASKYNSQNEFKKGSPKFFYTAFNRKMLDNLFLDRKKNTSYSDDDIRREASKYNSQNEFMKGSFNIFQIAKIRKMMDDLFPDRKRGSGGHNKKPDDEIRQESSKYNSQNEFMNGNRRMFNLAYKRGMLDDLFPDRKKNTSYSDDDIRREASKYNSQNEFMKGSFNIFQTAYKRGMLDDLFPNRRKRQNENRIYENSNN